MCTGPYKFTGWTQGQNITLTHNDGWWNTATKPKVKDLRFTFISDPAAQAAALASGDIDGQYGVPRAAHEQLAQGQPAVRAQLGLERGKIGIVGPLNSWWNMSLPVEVRDHFAETLPRSRVSRRQRPL